MDEETASRHAITRRHLLCTVGSGSLVFLSTTGFVNQALAASIDLGFAGGASTRPLTTAFPQKGEMILQRTRAPLLETPFDVFDKGVFTPNDRFFVRWHWPGLPNSIDVASFRLAVRGHVNRPLCLSLKELIQGFQPIELAAVDQCSGNSRGFFRPRVAGGEWGNGAMGNARWTGVRLKDVLDRAGVKAGAVQVRFAGLDEPVISEAPRFMKSLDIDHARDGEVMIAYAMNGEQMPLLNGFPIRLIVPGWYATYWIKMLSDIEVLDQPDTNFWMKTAYTIPDTPQATMKPGETGVKMVPINRMVPRSFFTNLHSGAHVPSGTPAVARGIAFGGDCGVAKVEISTDGGASWQTAQLGRDEGAYSFRQWQAPLTLTAGKHKVMVRCTNTKGLAQPDTANWNPAGFMRNVIESLDLIAA